MFDGWSVAGVKNPRRLHRSFGNVRVCEGTCNPARNATRQFCRLKFDVASAFLLSNRVEPCQVTESRSENDMAQSDERLRSGLNHCEASRLRSAGLAVLGTHQTNLKKNFNHRGAECSGN